MSFDYEASQTAIENQFQRLEYFRTMARNENVRAFRVNGQPVFVEFIKSVRDAIPTEETIKAAAAKSQTAAFGLTREGQIIVADPDGRVHTTPVEQRLNVVLEKFFEGRAHIFEATVAAAQAAFSPAQNLEARKPEAWLA